MFLSQTRPVCFSWRDSENILSLFESEGDVNMIKSTVDRCINAIHIEYNYVKFIRKKKKTFYRQL